jgi:hypothetical protein
MRGPAIAFLLVFFGFAVALCYRTSATSTSRC